VAVSPLQGPAAKGPSDPPAGGAADPVRILRERWRLLLVAVLAGGAAGIAVSMLRPAKYEAQGVLIVGNVVADVLHPNPGSKVPLQSPDEMVTWLSQPATQSALLGPEGSGVEVGAETAGQWMLVFHARAADPERATQAIQTLFTRVEAIHRKLYDEWKQHVDAIAAAQQQRSENLDAIAISTGPIFSRPTARLAAPSVTRLPTQKSRAGIAGAAAAGLFAWLSLFGLALRRAA